MIVSLKEDTHKLNGKDVTIRKPLGSKDMIPKI